MCLNNRIYQHCKPNISIKWYFQIVKNNVGRITTWLFVFLYWVISVETFCHLPQPIACHCVAQNSASVLFCFMWTQLRDFNKRAFIITTVSRTGHLIQHEISCDILNALWYSCWKQAQNFEYYDYILF